MGIILWKKVIIFLSLSIVHKNRCLYINSDIKKIERRRNAVLTKTVVFMILKLLYANFEKKSIFCLKSHFIFGDVLYAEILMLKKFRNNFTCKFIVTFN